MRGVVPPRLRSMFLTQDPASSAVAPVPSAAVILAAGKSTRMRSNIPKPLHPVCGRPLSRHVIEACRNAGVQRVIVVVGHEAELVRSGLGDDVDYVLQAEQLGTGHAALCAESALADHEGCVLIVAGDVPLLRPGTLQMLLERLADPALFGAMLVAYLDDPTGYGRVIMDEDGFVLRIVEQKDATPEEAAIRAWNPSVYCFRTKRLWELLRRIRSENAQQEYYLTDVVALARDEGLRVAGVPLEDPEEVLGVNSRVELAQVAAVMRRRILDEHMLAGVTITDPATTYIDAGVRIGRDTVVEPQTHLAGGTVVGERCVIGPMAVVRDSRIGEEVSIVLSHVEGAEIESGSRIGPFSRLRPGTRILPGAKIGNFVEIKNSVIGEGVSAAHLSYLGDADVGAQTNIGAGTITCNYDGFTKHRTRIGKGAFIGSNSVLVAPITVGDGALTAAGSTLTEDVPANALAIGRARQVIREGWAQRWREAREKRRRLHEQEG